jgi:hypothetical protein
MLQDYKLFFKLYSHLSLEQPMAEDYLKAARKIVAQNRLRYLFGHQQNY